MALQDINTIQLSLRTLVADSEVEINPIAVHNGFGLELYGHGDWTGRTVRSRERRLAITDKFSTRHHRRQ